MVFMGESIYESVTLHNGGHDELRTYIVTHVHPGQSFFVLGYSILVLPRNTESIRIAGAEIVDRIQREAPMGEKFVYRHIKNWEETSQLMLFDMIDFRSDQGYDYYNFYDHGERFFLELASSKVLDYAIVADGFPLGSYPEIEGTLVKDYVLVAECRGPGGGGHGMRYKIYKKL